MRAVQQGAWSYDVRQGLYSFIQRIQIRFKQSSKGFSKSEVFVTLIIQTLRKCILAVDREGVEGMARLAGRLRKDMLSSGGVIQVRAWLNLIWVAADWGHL